MRRNLVVMIIQKTKNAEPRQPVQHLFFGLPEFSYGKIFCIQSALFNIYGESIVIFLVIVIFITAAAKHILELVIHFKIIIIAAFTALFAF